MPDQIPKNDLMRPFSRKGLSPAEVLIYSLCSDDICRKEIFNEVINRLEVLPHEPHMAFEACLDTLKKHGLIIY